MDKTSTVNRRNFLSALGVTVGGTGLAGAGLVAGPQLVKAATEPPKGKIPDTPYKTGHMTFLTGPAAVLGEPSLKGHTLAAEEINAQGGLLGKRKIETITADEAAGTDANVKELRRMKLEGKIDLFTGVISSGNTPALGPVAEEMSLLTIFVDGCTDFLFDKAVPQPKYTFRITNIQSADGITSAIGAAQAWPQVRKIAHLHPDYTYGRNAAEHFTLAIERLLPGTQVVSESWPKLGTTDFTAHITKILSSNPDLLFTSGDRWPINKAFVQRYHKRWNEYPNFQSDGAYATLYMLKNAIERANKLVGGWPDDEAIISQLEGMGYDAPSGYLYIRPDNHQGYKDAVIGFSKNNPEYPFPTWDPNRIITIPIRNITAPPNWPKPGQGHNESTAAANWIKTTWPKAMG